MAEHSTASAKVETSGEHLPLSPDSRTAVAMLEREVAKGTFTAWSFAGGSSVASCFFADEITPPLEGNCDWSRPLHPLFDLASLTKPLFTNALLRRRFAHRTKDLFVPLVEILQKPHTTSGEIILEHLIKIGSSLSLADFLNHRSGVKPWTWMGRCLWSFDDEERQTFAKAPLYPQKPEEWRETLARQLTRHLIRDVAAKPCDERYSDIGFSLVARILEAVNIANESVFSWRTALQEQNELLGTDLLHASLHPERVKHAVPFHPYWRIHDQHIPSNSTTEYAFGLVNDTNANILASEGVVTGHAGLFGTIDDVLSGAALLAKTQAEFSDEERRAHPRFSVGLDTPTSADSSAGVNEWPLPPGREVFGHLGYTGTALWFALQNGLHCGTQALLTNRTARRTSIGCTDNARILVVEPTPKLTWTDEKLIRETQGETHYFVQRKPKGKWTPMPRNDVEELIVARSRASHLAWDTRCLRQVPNINVIRRECGKLLW